MINFNTITDTEFEFFIAFMQGIKEGQLKEYRQVYRDFLKDQSFTCDMLNMSFDE